jgi:hypothetical protein
LTTVPDDYDRFYTQENWVRWKRTARSDQYLKSTSSSSQTFPFSGGFRVFRLNVQPTDQNQHIEREL